MTSHDPLSKELRRFIAQHLVAVEELEVLLLLWRGHERWWSCEEVAGQFSLAEGSVRRWLEGLSGRFFEVRVGGALCYRFAPGNPDREQRVRELAMAYKERRTEVMALVLAGRAARRFADAFRLKKGKDE
jgi:hypothetical protein